VHLNLEQLAAYERRPKTPAAITAEARSQKPITCTCSLRWLRVTRSWVSVSVKAPFTSQNSGLQLGHVKQVPYWGTQILVAMATRQPWLVCVCVYTQVQCNWLKSKEEDVLGHNSFRSHCGPGVDSASSRNEYQQSSPGGKDGRCVGPTTLPPSCTDCPATLKPQPPGTPRACPGL
jgi:hypothetical protein